MDVLNLLEDWYGKGFMEVEHSKHGSAFVKVDGNRRITLFKKSFDEVYVVFTDLSVEAAAGLQAIKPEDDSLVVE
jgi:hypothetical protein